ncbi:S8 family serine peptidase [Ardenticatena maritima]|uniref:S8 family serine peptidase n=2 Tax=Ardenticatena maritima TaxID=872965 RepID=UPI000760CA3F|nr:S8 family serine peptidase [Ardenticatena maritima]
MVSRRVWGRLLGLVVLVLGVCVWGRPAHVLADAPPETYTWLVTLAPGVDGAGLAAEYGVAVVGEVPALALVALQASADVGAQLASDARVLSVSRDVLLDSQPRYIGFDGAPLTAQPRYIGFDGVPAEYGDQWARGVVRLDKAHQLATGQGVVVAVLDTGVDLDHPLLVDKLVPGYDVIDGDSLPDDVPNGIDQDGDGAIDEAAGHGTHVAGIVAMVAPDARIMPVRIFDSDGRGSYFDAIQGILYAVDHGADIINLSGHGPEDAPALQAAVAYAQAHGVLIVAAGGVNVLGYPALYDGVVSVGATDRYDLLTDFSTFQNGVAEVYAPGREIFSAYYNGGYAVWSGNSMATPFAAGAAALLRSVPGCDVACVVNTLRQTGRPLVQHPEAKRIDLYDALLQARGETDIAVRLQYRRGDTAWDTTTIVPQFRLVNDGGTIPYSALRIRYWLTPETAHALQAVVDYAAQGNENVTVATGQTTDGHTFVEVGFTDGAGLLYGGKAVGDGEFIQVNVHDAEWSAQDETNDYSFGADVVTWQEWERVTVYYDGRLVWGQEPAQPTNANACTVTFTVESSWDGGATVNAVVTNNQPADVDGWTLEWDWGASVPLITNMWNGSFMQNGGHVVVTNADWNHVVPAGGYVSFGFTLQGNAAGFEPAGLSLNGAPCSQ